MAGYSLHSQARRNDRTKLATYAIIKRCRIVIRICFVKWKQSTYLEIHLNFIARFCKSFPFIAMKPVKSSIHFAPQSRAPANSQKKPSSRSFHAKVKISMFGLHANPEKISKADLSHIVRNVLVIHQSSTVASVLWLNGRIGLKNGQHCKMVKSLLLTILIPFKDGWTHSASFQAFGPILPCPQLDRSISMVLVV